MLANVIICVGLFLAFLDLIFWRYMDSYRHHAFLQFAVILLGIGILLGAHGFITV